MPKFLVMTFIIMTFPRESHKTATVPTIATAIMSQYQRVVLLTLILLSLPAPAGGRPVSTALFDFDGQEEELSFKVSVVHTLPRQLLVVVGMYSCTDSVQNKAWVLGTPCCLGKLNFDLFNRKIRQRTTNHNIDKHN